MADVEIVHQDKSGRFRIENRDGQLFGVLSTGESFPVEEHHSTRPNASGTGWVAVASLNNDGAWVDPHANFAHSLAGPRSCVSDATVKGSCINIGGIGYIRSDSEITDCGLYEGVYVAEGGHARSSDLTGLCEVSETANVRDCQVQGPPVTALRHCQPEYVIFSGQCKGLRGTATQPGDVRESLAASEKVTALLNDNRQQDAALTRDSSAAVVANSAVEAARTARGCARLLGIIGITLSLDCVSSPDLRPAPTSPIVRQCIWQ